MNLCINCKFYSPRVAVHYGHEYTVRRCSRTGRVDPVDGKRKGMDECSAQRSFSMFGSTCGKDGKHFESKV